MKGRAYIGTSGWNYPHWAKGVFYPEGLQPSEWLRFYGRHFDTVEINNTFYHLPAASVFEQWRAATGRHFVFAVKASRYLTHMKKLASPEDPLKRLLAGAKGLGKNLAVILFQLPPFWKFNPERLEGLLASLKKQSAVPRLRAALEIRHPSWNTEECFRILRQYKAALVFADQPGFAENGPLTANFVFVRRHGPKSVYSSNYSESRLRRDAGRVRDWLAGGRDVYVYFNNDANGYAVKNALRLKKLLNEGSGRP